MLISGRGLGSERFAFGLNLDQDVYKLQSMLFVPAVLLASFVFILEQQRGLLKRQGCAICVV